MCYNIQILIEKGIVNNIRSRYSLEEFDYDKDEIDDDFGYYHVSAFAKPYLPVITMEQPRHISMMRWSLIPFWVEDKQNPENSRKAAEQWSVKTPNCIGEDMFKTLSYRHLPLKKRCIIPVTGFYDSYTNPVNEKDKYPFYIYPTQDKFFSIAGLYDSWVDKDSGEILNTFTMITTKSNSMMSKIHNIKFRMPVILPDRDAELKWLSPGLTKEQVNEFIVPCSDSLMSAHAVAKFVNSARELRNIPAATAKAFYPAVENLLD